MMGTVWTIVIALAIFVYVAFVIRSMYRKHKSGGACTGCSGCSSSTHNNGGCEKFCTLAEKVGEKELISDSNTL